MRHALMLILTTSSMYMTCRFCLCSHDIVPVQSCAVLARLVPFVLDLLGVLGAIQIAILTVILPVQMHIKQRVQSRSTRWYALQLMNLCCCCVAQVACIGSICPWSKTQKDFESVFLNEQTTTHMYNSHVILERCNSRLLVCTETMWS